jgi:hypothetical protein
MDNTLRLARLPNATAYHWRMPEVSRRNPDWEWDEIVPACDLVRQNDWRALPAENPQVIELSELLQRMTLHPLDARRPDFRNPNGVGRKTADIATHHPGYTGRPTHGNAMDGKVMAQFIAEPDVMHALAQSIRDSLQIVSPPTSRGRSDMRAKAQWRGGTFFAGMPTASGTPRCGGAR